jgi:hypothetical protein
MPKSRPTVRFTRLAFALTFRIAGGLLTLAAGLLGSPWSAVLDHDRKRWRRARRA